MLILVGKIFSVWELAGIYGAFLTEYFKKKYSSSINNSNLIFSAQKTAYYNTIFVNCTCRGIGYGKNS